MENINQFLSTCAEQLGTYLPTVVGAIVILILGKVLATWIRKGAKALLGRMKVNERLQGKAEKPVDVQSLVANLLYYVLLLYVLVLTLGVLGVRDVLDPVKLMFIDVMDAVPNILAAVLIAFAGYVIARLLAEPVKALASGLDKHTSKLGLAEGFSLSRLLSQLVFITVFIPILMAAFDALKIDAISVPAVGMLSSLMAAVPRIIAAAVILAVAYLIGNFVANVIAELLDNVGANAVPAKLGIQKIMGEKLTFSRFVAKMVLFFIMLGATISAVEKLELTQISLVLNELLLFAGHIVLGLVILAVGALVANAAAAAVNHDGQNAGMAAIARIAILGLVLAMGLQAMGIADEIVHIAFTFTVGAIAIAVAVSFGIGGREAAGKQMEYWLAKLRKDG